MQHTMKVHSLSAAIRAAACWRFQRWFVCLRATRGPNYQRPAPLPNVVSEQPSDGPLAQYKEAAKLLKPGHDPATGAGARLVVGVRRSGARCADDRSRRPATRTSRRAEARYRQALASLQQSQAGPVV